MADGEGLVRIYSTGSVSDGYLAKGRLEADGIPVLLKGEGEGPYRAGPMFLFVPRNFEAEARAIMASVAELAEEEGL